jgi:hypothetical protein
LHGPIRPDPGVECFVLYVCSEHRPDFISDSIANLPPDYKHSNTSSDCVSDKPNTIAYRLSNQVSDFISDFTKSDKEADESDVCSDNWISDLTPNICTESYSVADGVSNALSHTCTFVKTNFKADSWSNFKTDFNSN